MMSSAQSADRSNVFQQTVSGTVVDEQGMPFPGVTILVKGTSQGTNTDMDGHFEIEAGPQDILVASFVGFETQEIPVNQKTNFSITMIENVDELDQVVVVGYGTTKKSDVTGSISSLNNDDFNKGAQTSINELIQGRAAGVQITQADAEPGGLFSIKIRGSNSITGGNEPLYVIDGLPGAPLNALNPGDIESIEILKDASATAIYGSRGANGVVMITTKKGKAGAFRINYDGYVGVQNAAKTLDLLNAQEYVSFINGLQEDQGLDPIFTDADLEGIGQGTDWQNEILRTAYIQNHQLSFSGGSENTGYYVSLGHFDQDGVIINTGLKRTTGRININHDTDKFKFGINLNTSYVEDQSIPRSVYGINADAGVIATSIQFDPLQPVYNEDGTYSESSSLDLDNPVAQANTISNVNETNRTFGNVFAEYEFVNNLSAKLNLGSDRRISRFDNYISKVTKRGQRTNGAANVSEAEDFSKLLEFTLHYQNTFNDLHQLEVLAGYTYQDFINRGFNATSQNFPTDAFGTNNLGAGAQDKYNLGSYKNKNQLLSYLGRVNYTYNDKYLLTASFRIDGSSRFGKDQKYGYFPSLALSWKMGEEEFIKRLNTFSTLKLRTSYGITGNQAIGNYNSLVLLGTTGNATFNGQEFVGIAPIQLGNPDLKWESTAQFNVGLDFGFLKNRIAGSMDYYKKKTSDLLLNLPIPSTSGFTTSLQNVGDTENTGFEFLVDSKNLVGDFQWSTSLNFSTLHNKVTSLGELPFILQGNIRFINDLTILKEGSPINSYYGYQTAGVFQNEDEVAQSAQPNASPGDLKFEDTNGDGQITPDDRVILGDPFPNFNFGLSNTFAYKGFDLSIFFDGSFGNELLNFTKIDSENPISPLRNRQTYVLNRWTLDNPTNENPSFINNSLARALNDRVVEDASFVRLRNVNLGYNFPGLSVKWLNSLYVYATAQNLFTITDYTGYNPEVSSLGDSNLKVDYNAYPISRTFTLGIKLGI
ncbi:MAG: TonB-dependent receptor [Christiangramia sp.]